MTGTHNNEITFNKILLLSASSVITSILANILLETSISIEIVMARRFNINSGMI
jgi:hypothetical protein